MKLKEFNEEHKYALINALKKLAAVFSRFILNTEYQSMHNEFKPYDDLSESLLFVVKKIQELDKFFMPNSAENVKLECYHMHLTDQFERRIPINNFINFIEIVCKDCLNMTADAIEAIQYSKKNGI